MTILEKLGLVFYCIFNVIVKSLINHLYHILNIRRYFVEH